MRRRQLLKVLLAGAALALAGCSHPAPSFKSTDVTGTGLGADFRLTDTAGRVRTLKDYRGKVVLLYFGYLHCPDVCPTTLARLNSLLQKMGPDAGKVQVLFITLDPTRDTPALLKPYVHTFNPTFDALWGNAKTIDALAAAFKIFHEKHREAKGEGYTIDHSSPIYAYDAQGRLRLLIAGERSDDDILHDLHALIQS